MNTKSRIVIIGGGAAGFFAALAAKAANTAASVIILEQSAKVLSKVKISGGGRCNVTHACFDPKQLVTYYPRGFKELLGPFHHFQPKDTMQWFSKRGVELKIEEDGRIFPVTDSSQTIIDCLLKQTELLGVTLKLKEKIQSITKTEQQFALSAHLEADCLILATGSSPIGWEIAQSLGHTIQPPVPSLFTLNIPYFLLAPLAGVCAPNAVISIQNTPFSQQGPLLITHWGFSGPAALKLSAFAARLFAETGYKNTLSVDWVGHLTKQDIHSWFNLQKQQQPAKLIGNISIEGLPKRLWKMLIHRCDFPEKPLHALTKQEMMRITEILKSDVYHMEGKTTHKEEFVTCGGICLSEVNFKTMQSKVCPNLYFCGEILDIDGITGGFNFQNAWTTGWIAGQSAALSNEKTASQ